MSVILGGQQAWLLPHSVSIEDAERYKEKLQSSRRRMVFASQAPMMCICWAIVFFLVGLTVVVVSPFAINRVWGDDAKVCSIGSATKALPMSLLRLWTGDDLLLSPITERHQRADRHFTDCQRLLRVKVLGQPDGGPTDRMLGSW